MFNSTHDYGHGPDEPPEDGGGSGNHGGNGGGPAHNTINVIVITTADDLDRPFNLQEPLRPVFEQALTLVGGHAESDQFVLEFGDIELTELDAKLGDLKERLGWGDTVQLELVPRPVVV